MATMPRSYRDAAELRGELVDRKIHPLVPEGTALMLGIGFPAVDDPVPLMLAPGNEYRIRQIMTTSDSDGDGAGGGEKMWIVERRSTAKNS